MINLAVINLKDIKNFIKKFLIGTIIFFIILKFCINIKNGKYVDLDKLRERTYIDYCKIINSTLILSNYYQKEEKFIKKSGIKKILGAEFVILEVEEELMEKENQEEMLELEEEYVETSEELKSETENLKMDIEENLTTMVISEKNKTDTYTDVYKNVKIKNESKYQLTEDILMPNFNLLNNKDIVIYHTHTCESYTPTQQNNYQASGSFRTTDLNYNVVRVGSELEKNLINSNFNVIHNKTLHDYPAYSGSYTRSLSTIKNIIAPNYSRFSD